MGRPIYPFELTDPDFSWLIESFQEHNPSYRFVEHSCLPVVFISGDENRHSGLGVLPPPATLDPTAEIPEEQ